MADENNELSGFKGWLLFVGLGVTLAPIQILWALYMVDYVVYSDEAWTQLIDPNSPDYTPYYATSVILETLVTLVQLILVLWQAYLFYTKSPLFPKVFIGLSLLAPVILVICYWLRTWPYPEDTLFSEELVIGVIRSCIPAAIWIPYMLLSKRVQNTFVREPAVATVEP